MRKSLRLTTLASIAVLMVAACGSSTDTLLGKVEAAKKIVMSTDPQYPPQSSLKDDGTYEGFDIDVGTEIAKRLGVEIEFTTPDWNIITAGSWSGRWDFSVGSMTITTPREKILAFTKPYYYTPAQMAASTASGITTLEGLAGKTICAGAATTYYDWLTGALDVESSEKSDTRLHAGLEASKSIKEDQTVALRAGLDNKDLNFGFGLGFAFWKVTSIVDFTYTIEHIAPDDAVTVSWGVLF